MVNYAGWILRKCAARRDLIERGRDWFVMYLDVT